VAANEADWRHLDLIWGGLAGDCWPGRTDPTPRARLTTTASFSPNVASTNLVVVASGFAEAGASGQNAEHQPVHVGRMTYVP
jgi:hypothetical protein